MVLALFGWVWRHRQWCVDNTVVAAVGFAAEIDHWTPDIGGAVAVAALLVAVDGQLPPYVATPTDIPLRLCPRHIAAFRLQKSGKMVAGRLGCYCCCRCHLGRRGWWRRRTSLFCMPTKWKIMVHRYSVVFDGREKFVEVPYALS